MTVSPGLRGERVLLTSTSAVTARARSLLLLTRVVTVALLLPVLRSAWSAVTLMVSVRTPGVAGTVGLAVRVAVAPGARVPKLTPSSPGVARVSLRVTLVALLGPLLLTRIV